MTPDEISKWYKALLLKIHIITGWVVPEAEMLKILGDQFVKKLQEDYGSLNMDEIEYAFRKRGTTIQDWGKTMNLNLIDQVLIPYLNERVTASFEEEKKKRVPPPQNILTDEEILNERRGQIEQAFQAMKLGYYPILHVYFEEVLRQDELLQKDENVPDFFVRMLNNQVKNLYVKEK